MSWRGRSCHELYIVLSRTFVHCEWVWAVLGGSTASGLMFKHEKVVVMPVVHMEAIKTTGAYDILESVL